MINSSEEEILDFILNNYKDKYEMIIDTTKLPYYLQFSIKDSMNQLKYAGLISYYDLFIDGECQVVITNNALQYYNYKGGRTELFNELSNSDKELLKEIIEISGKKGDISEFLRKKIENDEDDINRGIIGNLKSNGLIKVLWADDTVWEASLTQNGRSFFEREKKYLDSIKSNVTYISATNSNVVMGNVVNSNINISNVAVEIENDIEEKCNTDLEKEELRELLEEAKEIIDDYSKNNCFTPRKGFFKRMMKHFDTHGWFYAEIVSMLGQFALMKISGQ